VDRAERWFASALGYANDLGLLSEEGDVANGALLGNFPQAFSHVGLVSAAWRLSEASTPHDQSPSANQEIT
jgi:GH15 family glucan-1,4-alpha-glucosidase